MTPFLTHDPDFLKHIPAELLQTHEVQVYLAHIEALARIPLDSLRPLLDPAQPIQLDYRAGEAAPLTLVAANGASITDRRHELAATWLRTFETALHPLRITAFSARVPAGRQLPQRLAAMLPAGLARALTQRAVYARFLGSLPVKLRLEAGFTPDGESGAGSCEFDILVPVEAGPEMHRRLAAAAEHASQHWARLLWGAGPWLLDSGTQRLSLEGALHEGWSPEEGAATRARLSELVAELRRQARG